jgi:cell division protein FtsZ
MPPAGHQHPLLENASIEGAKSVLVNLAGSTPLPCRVPGCSGIVTERCADDALVIAGQALTRNWVTVSRLLWLLRVSSARDVVGAELADMDMVKRRYAASAKRDTARMRSLQPARKNESTRIASIQVNRLQIAETARQRTASNANDYNIPAVRVLPQ